MNTIFVNIASYRDHELIPTIQDCLNKSFYPHNLRFGIAWQHAEDDNSLLPYKENSQFRIADILSQDSKGCCWARSISQAFYNGERYVLQLDSHMRFVQGWDKILIDMLETCSSSKPVLTAYAGSYDETGFVSKVPWQMKPKCHFGHDGALLCIPVPFDKPCLSPVPARFLSAHFLFARGQYSLDVPYDPLLYFTGEEPTLAVRSFTHGYDLFHPHRLVIYHRYTREGRVRHWDDHKITEPDLVSKSRVRQLLEMEPCVIDFGSYGLGTERTLHDYELFAGIDFKNRRIHQECFDGIAPPASTDDRWAIPRKVLVHWKSDVVELPPDTTKVAFFVDDAEHKMLWHQDAFQKTDFQCDTVAEFSNLREPAFLVVWPHTAKGPGPKKYQFALRQNSVYST